MKTRRSDEGVATKSYFKELQRSLNGKESFIEREAPFAEVSLGIQAWFLAQPHTGIAQHSLGLIQALAKKNIRLCVVVPCPVSFKGLPKNQIKTLPPKWWILHGSLRKWYWERFQVPAFFEEQNLDYELYTYPCPLPKDSKHKRAMTVHDTILWDDERYKGGFFKSLYHKASKRTLVNMEKLFAVSKATQKALKMPGAIIMPNAVTVPENILPSDYKNSLIYLGGYDIRKRVPELINAFKKVREKNPEMNLCLIGKPHHSSKYYPRLPKADGVIFLGSLSDNQVYSALSSAFALVHFSDSEGFNLPILQAMKVGLPVIARDIPVNREVSAGQAVLLKNPNGKTLLEAIDYVKRNRKRIIGNQRKVAETYSWKESANILIKSL